MGNLIKYSDFNISESSAGDEYSIDQIGIAIDYMEGDFEDLFFVPNFNSDAISIYCDISGDTANITTEISSDLEYYDIDYDRNDLSKMFRSALKEALEASVSGPKFSLAEILESAEELLDGEGAKDYIAELDISDAEVYLREGSYSGSGSDENGILVFAEFDSSTTITVDGVDTERFKENLIKKLISNIAKRPNFES